MKNREETRTGHLARALLAGTFALLLVLGLSLLLSHFRVLAQPEAGNLAASKSVHPSWARPGEDLTYTVRITNTGNEPVWAAWMTDSLPSEVNYSAGLNASTGTWGRIGNVITWTGLLTPDDAVAITFVVQITDTLNEDASFSFVNTAMITGAGSLVTPSVEATAITTFTIWLPLIFHEYPPIAELYDIPTPGANNSYRVSWESIETDPPHDGYVLQEATNAGFTENVKQWTTYNTYRDFEKGSAVGTYYYRVRVDDADRWGEGPWSNVESVSIGFYDDFSNSSSGWPNRSGLIWDGDGWDVWWYTRYLTSVGHYQIKIDLGPAPVVWFYQPDALAPYRPPGDKYCVETQVWFKEPGWWDNAGLIFGADEANTDIYALCLDVRADYHTWFVLRNSEYEFPKQGCAYEAGKIASGSQGTTWNDWNKLQVGVDGDWVTVYVGGIKVGKWEMPELSSKTRVGLIGGDYEVSDIDIRFDYFKVIPNVSCTP